MKRILHMNKICVLSICAVCMFPSSMEVMAAGTQNAKNILKSASAGVLVSSTMTADEYIAVAKEAKGAHWGYTNLGIAEVESGNLNVREAPSVSGKLVGKMPKGAACEILDLTDGWYYITSGEVEGYVSAEYVLTGPEAVLKAEELVKTVATVTTDGVNVREGAGLDSAVITQVPKGEALEYVETLEGWVKVSLDGVEAYISDQYVVIEDKLETAITMSQLLYGMGVSDVRVDLVEYAKQFLGNPYVWGGTSLTKGADCSGFVLSVYKKYGVTLPHYSVSQSRMGTKISFSQIQPGDLIFYADSKGTINHVAIYIGNNQVIHASSPKTGIKISTYNYRTPIKYVSLLND